MGIENLDFPEALKYLAERAETISRKQKKVKRKKSPGYARDSDINRKRLVFFLFLWCKNGLEAQGY